MRLADSVSPLSVTKEISKFAAGFFTLEAVWAVLYYASDLTMDVFGVRYAPNGFGVIALVSAILAIGLGVYAWIPIEATRQESDRKRMAGG